MKKREETFYILCESLPQLTFGHFFCRLNLKRRHVGAANYRLLIKKKKKKLSLIRAFMSRAEEQVAEFYPGRFRLPVIKETHFAIAR